MAAPKRRSTIGADPLDAVVPGRSAEPVAAAAEPGLVSEVPAPPNFTKERLTVHVTTGVIDRVKNAVYWTPGLTLSRLAEEALHATVDRLEEARGEPFPRREAELTGGRPPK